MSTETITVEGKGLARWREGDVPSLEDPEQWRPVNGHGGKYIVSSYGRVAKLLKGRPAKNGYIVVCLSHAIKSKLVYIHRLVARAFLGPSNGLWVHHRNNVKFHNEAENLEYVTRGENTAYAVRDGLYVRGERNPSAVLTWEQVREIRTLCGQGEISQREIGERFGIIQAHVSDIHLRKIWREE